MRTRPVLHEAENEAEATKFGLEDLTSCKSVSIIIIIIIIITHADGSRVSVALIRICYSVCVRFCLTVINIKSKGQRSSSQGHKV